VWSEPPRPLAAPTPPEPPPGDKQKLRAKLKETIEGARDRMDESREERAAKQRDKQQQRLEKQRRKPVP
jgi:septal ring factor EnvC (AmiA/AmiB activator)